MGDALIRTHATLMLRQLTHLLVFACLVLASALFVACDSDPGGGQADVPGDMAPDVSSETAAEVYADVPGDDSSSEDLAEHVELDGDVSMEVGDTTDTQDVHVDAEPWEVLDDAETASETDTLTGLYEPCSEDADCGSGLCIWATDERVCGEGQACPEHWSCRDTADEGAIRLACVPTHQGLCRPCDLDGDCLAFAYPHGTRCVSLGSEEGSYCLTTCGATTSCPDGYDCGPLSPPADGEIPVMVCRPAGAACTCDAIASSHGLSTSCVIENDEGACLGRRHCGALQGMGDCDALAPTAETCNGLDDNCDGVTDELGWIDCGLGACATSVELCLDGVVQTCEALAPDDEVCNGVDDDCDGDTDEELGEKSCGIGACATSVPTCEDGAPVVCVPLSPAGAEICDGIDDDCDGDTDEDLGLLSCGLGACANQVAACEDGVDGLCEPLDLGSAEACDGEDNDCDGLTDEDFGATTCGLGICAVTVVDCQGGTTQTCEPGDAEDEICNGLDDDCDGATDEDLGEESCGMGACVTTVARCQAGQPQVCQPAPPADGELCNGIDDDCDGETDEGLGVEVCGEGACQVSVPRCLAGEVSVCVPGSAEEDELCNGLDDDCDGATDEELGVEVCGEGACQVSAARCVDGEPQACQPLAPGPGESCNGVDDDCDGDTDEGFGEDSCGEGVCHVTVARCQDGVLQGCSPLPVAVDESCNGLDDDCDGQTDEGLGSETCGVGACEVTVEVCVGALPQECVPAPAGQEVCNGLDDDCDGATDEELGTVSCGLGVCQVTVAACLDGEPPPCVPLEGADGEGCNGLDDDCDGDTDEGFATETCGVGACARTVETCLHGDVVTCEAGTPAPFEICNGLDDDCDGSSDEDLGSTSCGVGPCKRTMKNCDGGEAQTCVPGPGADSDPCNGVDDDCDGDTDEDGGGPTCNLYADIDADLASLSSAELLLALGGLVAGHHSLGYYGSNNARVHMYKVGGIDVGADGRVECLYTARTSLSSISGNGILWDYAECRTADGALCETCDTLPGDELCAFNTEHSWPRSWLKGSLGDGTVEYLTAEADIHNLFPTWWHVNSQRSNNPYGESDCAPDACLWPKSYEAPELSVLGASDDADYGHYPIFDVRQASRGNVARAWFYVCLRYDLWIDDKIEAVLRSWHVEDPPDAAESARNDAIQSLQYNRNPFVDRPGYVDHINNF